MSTDKDEDVNLAKELVAPLIKLMESGELPWRQPWHLNGLLRKTSTPGRDTGGLTDSFF
jgi:antirestriction protein ArdC